MTPAQITKAAQDAVTIANQAKSLYNRCLEFVAYNTVMSHDWNSDPASPISGTEALPSDIANSINAMTKVIAMWEGAGVDAVNYGQLFDKLSFPLA